MIASPRNVVFMEPLYDDSKKMNGEICIQTCLAVNVILYYKLFRE